MRALIGLLALMVTPMASAAAQSLSSTAQTILLAPLSLVFGDIGGQLRLFGAGIRALDAQRIAVQKRTALVAELDQLIPAIEKLTAGKGQFFVVLAQEQQAARQRGAAPLNAEQIEARKQSWGRVQAGARLLEGDLRVVHDVLARSPTLNSELPSNTGDPLYEALKGKATLDAAIAKLAGGPGDPSRDNATLGRFASDYLGLRGELTNVTYDLRSFRRRLAESQ